MRYPSSKKELAIQYSPNVTMSAALSRLSRWIKSDPHLYSELVEAGYRDKQRVLSPRQVSIIFKHLGSPEEFIEASTLGAEYDDF